MDGTEFREREMGKRKRKRKRKGSRGFRGVIVSYSLIWISRVDRSVWVKVA